MSRRKLFWIFCFYIFFSGNAQPSDDFNSNSGPVLSEEDERERNFWLSLKLRDYMRFLNLNIDLPENFIDLPENFIDPSENLINFLTLQEVQRLLLRDFKDYYAGCRVHLKSDDKIFIADAFPQWEIQLYEMFPLRNSPPFRCYHPTLREIYETCYKINGMEDEKNFDFFTMGASIQALAQSFISYFDNNRAILPYLYLLDWSKDRISDDDNNASFLTSQIANMFKLQELIRSGESIDSFEKDENGYTYLLMPFRAKSHLQFCLIIFHYNEKNQTLRLAALIFINSQSLKSLKDKGYQNENKDLKNLILSQLKNPHLKIETGIEEEIKIEIEQRTFDLYFDDLQPSEGDYNCTMYTFEIMIAFSHLLSDDVFRRNFQSKIKNMENFEDISMCDSNLDLTGDSSPSNEAQRIINNRDALNELSDFLVGSLKKQLTGWYDEQQPKTEKDRARERLRTRWEISKTHLEGFIAKIREKSDTHLRTIRSIKKLINPHGHLRKVLVHHVEADGNCGFSSLGLGRKDYVKKVYEHYAAFLNDNQRVGDNILTELIEAVLKNHFERRKAALNISDKPFNDLTKEEKKKVLEDWKSIFSETRIWADEDDFRLISRLYNRRIHIYVAAHTWSQGRHFVPLQGENQVIDTTPTYSTPEESYIAWVAMHDGPHAPLTHFERLEIMSEASRGLDYETASLSLLFLFKLFLRHSGNDLASF